MAREVFTSENAYEGTFLVTNFDSNPETIKTFEQIKKQVDQLSDPEQDSSQARDYVA
jgi:hypothetical protein